jgi:hypothetical protein
MTTGENLVRKMISLALSGAVRCAQSKFLLDSRRSISLLNDMYQLVS